MALHTLILLVFKILNKFKAKESKYCWIFIINWIVTKVFLILTFGYYIRTLLESYQLLLISSISEIRDFNRSSLYHIISLLAAFILLVLWLVAIFVVSKLVFRIRQEDNSHDKLGEFFSEIKDSKISRLYIVSLHYKILFKFYFTLLATYFRNLYNN